MNLRRFTDTGEWTTRRYLALLGDILIWAIVAIDAFYLWPTQLHGSTSMVIVSGHSMEPTYFTGDLVIARKTEPSVGDVIVYAPESLGGSQIVHRIIGGNATDGWKMQGDNNNFVDPFTPKGSEVKGVVLVHYANFGRVTVLLLNPIVWALVLLAAVVLLVWWSGDTCEDDPEDKDKDKDKRADGGDPESEAEEEFDLIDRMVEGAEAAVSRMVSSAADAGTAALAALTRPSLAPRHAARTPRHAAPVLLRGSAVVAVLGLVSVFGLSPASASQLIVNAGSQASVMTDAKCGTQNLTVTPLGTSTGNTSTQITLSDIASACLDKPVTVYLHNSAGAVFATFTGTTPASGASMTLTLTGTATYDASLVSAAVVKVKGWLFLASWTPPSTQPMISCLPVNNGGNTVPGNGQSCVATVTGGSSWISYPGAWGVGAPNYHYSISFDVASSLNQWEITVDFSNTGTFPLYNSVPVYVGSGSNIVSAPGYSCSALPIFKGRKAVGNVPWNNQGVIYVTSAPGSTNGTTQLCP